MNSATDLPGAGRDPAATPCSEHSLFVDWWDFDPAVPPSAAGTCLLAFGSYIGNGAPFWGAVPHLVPLPVDHDTLLAAIAHQRRIELQRRELIRNRKACDGYGRCTLDDGDLAELRRGIGLRAWLFDIQTADELHALARAPCPDFADPRAVKRRHKTINDAIWIWVGGGSTVAIPFSDQSDHPHLRDSSLLLNALLEAVAWREARCRARENGVWPQRPLTCPVSAKPRACQLETLTGWAANNA